MSTKIFYIEITSNELRSKLKIKKKKRGRTLCYFKYDVETAQGKEKKKLFSLGLDEVKELFLDASISRSSFEIFEIIKIGEPLVRVTHKLFETVYFGN